VDDTIVAFDDGAVYERFMGRWSRAVGAIFLDWLAPPQNARWLDVGCGTGAFTRLILDTCVPADVAGVDPASEQIDYARTLRFARPVDFRVADAQALPFPEEAFDIVASALVINFIPDRHRALTEMRRVGRRGGLVAAYVWDFAAERGPTWPLIHGMRQIGRETPRIPGSEDTNAAALTSLFEQAGFDEVSVRSIDVTMAFPSFADFWQSNVPRFTPNGKAIWSLPDCERARLSDAVRAAVPTDREGRIAYAARANAVKGHIVGLG
jgi:ubiquinone/menaquinone biosynthesis C-methylase UbiE